MFMYIKMSTSEIFVIKKFTNKCNDYKIALKPFRLVLRKRAFKKCDYTREVLYKDRI